MKNILVARKTETGHTLVSSSGIVMPGAGASHPLVGNMTEHEHSEICRAAQWLLAEPATVDVDLECGFRVSLFKKGAKK